MCRYNQKLLLVDILAEKLCINREEDSKIRNKNYFRIKPYIELNSMFILFSREKYARTFFTYFLLLLNQFSLIEFILFATSLIEFKMFSASRILRKALQK